METIGEQHNQLRRSIRHEDRRRVWLVLFVGFLVLLGLAIGPSLPSSSNTTVSPGARACGYTCDVGP